MTCDIVRVECAVHSATGELLYVGSEGECLAYLAGIGDTIAAAELRRRAEEAEEAEST